MNLRELLPKLTQGNTDERLAALEELYSKDNTHLTKDLFEAIYDLKFHTDFQLKFWAKKVLNKFEGRIDLDRTVNSPIPPGQGEPGDEEEPQETPLPKVIELMESGAEDLPLEDVERVLETRDPEWVPAILGYLRNCRDLNQLSFLTKALGEYFPQEDILLDLAIFLKHEDTRIVANAVEGIGAIHSPKSFAILTQLLESPDNRVRSNVAVAIGKYNKAEAYQIVQKMLSLEGKSHMQISSCHAIKAIGDETFLNLLQPILEGENDVLIGEALNVFCHFTGEKTIQILKSIIPRVAHSSGRVKKYTEILEKIKKRTQVQEKLRKNQGTGKSWMY